MDRKRSTTAPAKRIRKIKILAVGAPRVGKSCLIKRFCEGKFVSRYIITIGVDYGVKQIDLGSEKVKVNFWDLSGSPMYKEIREAFYSNTEGLLLVFDVTCRQSFDRLDSFLKEIGDIKPHAFLIGNKVDLDARREVSKMEAERLARHLGFQYVEASASSGENVAAIFLTLFAKVVNVDLPHVSFSTKENEAAGAAAGKHQSGRKRNYSFSSKPRRSRQNSTHSNADKEPGESGSGKRAPIDESSGSQELDSQILKTKANDEEWNRFKRNPPTVIRYKDVPWPNKDNVLGTQPEDRLEVKKKRYREMCKRYHPDIFQNNYGNKLQPMEHDKIMANVAEICKLINKSKTWF